jgi:hypothetical protein
MNPHKWSGWPGAYCMKCGCEDPFELALCDNNIVYEYKGKLYDQPPEKEDGTWPAVEGVRSLIIPEKRHLYPSDECAVKEKKDEKNG